MLAVGGSRALARAASDPAGLRQLHRAIGNQEVGRVLLREERVPIRTSRDEARVPIRTSRDEERVPIKTGPTLIDDFLEPLRRALRATEKRSEEAVARANAALTEAQIVELRRQAGNRIDKAYTAYVDACNRVAASIKAAANQDAKWLALVFEVATGFLAPGMARGLAGLANRIPVDASAVTYRAAMAALNTDMTKQLFNSAAKVGARIMKDNAVVLAGETNTDQFIRELKKVTQRAFQKIDEELPNKTPAELGVVAAAFDWSVANVDTYTKEIKRLVDLFKREVEPIGWQPPSWGEATQFPYELAYIEDGKTKRLAIVQYKHRLFAGDYWFLRWVSPQMEQLALGRARAKQRKIETLKRTDVKMLR